MAERELSYVSVTPHSDSGTHEERIADQKVAETLKLERDQLLAALHNELVLAEEMRSHNVSLQVEREQLLVEIAVLRSDLEECRRALTDRFAGGRE